MRGHILYFHTGKSTFVDKDVRILEEVATTKTFAFTVTNKKQTPWLLLQQLFFLLRHFFTARLYVCQFAGYHSFLPGIFGKLLKRKTLIISGGTDFQTLDMAISTNRYSENSQNGPINFAVI
jgi:hypothetical protein